MTTFQINPYVESIVMPENLRVGLMVAEQRKKCGGGCNDDFAALAIGQSPFHVPPPLARALGEHAAKGHYSAAEGIAELREAIAGTYQDLIPIRDKAADVAIISYDS